MGDHVVARVADPDADRPVERAAAVADDVVLHLVEAAQARALLLAPVRRVAEVDAAAAQVLDAAVADDAVPAAALEPDAVRPDVLRILRYKQAQGWIK